MSWQSDDSSWSSWYGEIFQDAARAWGVERPSLKRVLVASVVNASLSAAFLFRLSARSYRTGHRWISALAARLNLALHGCQISAQARIGPGLHLPHPVGVVVGEKVQGGRDLTLFQNVTLGARGWKTEEYPQIGDGVKVFANSMLLGGIRVGDKACVGAFSLVLKDVEAGSTVIGVPALPQKEMDDHP